MDADRKHIIDNIDDTEQDEVTVMQQLRHEKSSRCLLAGVLITLVATLSVSVVVITIKILADSTGNTLNVHQPQDDVTASIEPTTSQTGDDIDDNVFEYHVTDPTNQQQTWIINDYNRGVQIFKLSIFDTRDVCYVTPLNSKQMEIINEQSSNIDVSHADIIKLNFNILPSSQIKDKSVLGSKGRVLCAVTDTHWIVPKCTDNTDTGDSSEMDGKEMSQEDSRHKLNTDRIRREASTDRQQLTPQQLRLRELLLQRHLDEEEWGDNISIGGFRFMGQYGRRDGRAVVK